MSAAEHADDDRNLHLRLDVDADPLRAVEQFVYREARLCDESAYEEWETLWTDDAVYWVPANADDIDPATQMSVIFDNRARIATRVRQLVTGKHHAQAPPSRLCRVVSNVELLAVDQSPPAGASGDGTGDVFAAAAFVVYESRERGLTTWAGRTTYRLRRVDGGLRMVAKTVRLVNNDRALPTLAFLI